MDRNRFVFAIVRAFHGLGFRAYTWDYKAMIAIEDKQQAAAVEALRPLVQGQFAAKSHSKG